MDFGGRWGRVFSALFVLGDPKTLHAYLVDMGLVPEEGTYMCPKCRNPLKLWRNSESTDGFQWYCTARVSLNKKKRRPCGTRVTYRKGTFLERSRLSTRTIILFCLLWISRRPLKEISENLGLSSNTCIDWASVCREVVFNAMMVRKQPLGGPGKAVEIDESKFGRRECRRGQKIEGQWVFGGYERGSGKIFLVPVEKRDRATLVPLVEEWVLPGTTIISDCWKAHEGMEDDLGYEHLRVNHSITFRNFETSDHSNSLVKLWNGAKRFVSSPTLRKKEHVPWNLARYMFHKRCMDLGLDELTEFLKSAGELYDPRRSRDETSAPGVSSSLSAGPNEPSTSSSSPPPDTTSDYIELAPDIGATITIASAEEHSAYSQEDIHLFN